MLVTESVEDLVSVEYDDTATSQTYESSGLFVFKHLFFRFRRGTISSETVFCVHGRGEARLRKVVFLFRSLPSFLI